MERKGFADENVAKFVNGDVDDLVHAATLAESTAMKKKWTQQSNT